MSPLFVVMGLIGAAVGFYLLRWDGVAIGFVVGAVFWMQRELKEELRLVGLRLDAMERRGLAREPLPESPARPDAEAPPGEPPASETKPDTVPPPISKPARSEPPNAAAAARPEPESPPQPDFGERALARVRAFLVGGNPIVRVGVVLLFCGVAFLLKYAADRHALPLELRLAGVAAGGIGMLVVGWRLRGRNALYALVVQGGAVGILYLTVFSAARMYHFLPMGLAMVVMVGLVALSAVLAVLQDGLPLAAFGSAGGFLAPILLSTGHGSHVALFAYYAALNAGILGVAWHRAWRPLNLVGFVFTFGLGAAWGYRFYQPAHFPSTEPFLILFFLFFAAIAVLFAFRQPPRLRGYVDGTLVFGTPLVAFGLQAGLVRHIPYGLAFSALAIGGFYVALASALWRRRAPGLRLLTEAFLALAVVFLTLAVPLALSGRWTASTWALEGAGLIWVGVRQRRPLARLAGAVLEVGAGVMLLADLDKPLGPYPVLNGFYLGCLLIALAAVGSAYYLHRARSSLNVVERWLATALMGWGLMWWLVGGVEELIRHLRPDNSLNGIWALLIVTSALLGYGARRLEWSTLALPALGLVPAMALGGLLTLASGHDHLMFGWGAVPWLGFLAVQYGLLRALEETWPREVVRIWHPLSLGLAVAILGWECLWLVDGYLHAARSWALASAAVVPLAAVWLILKGRVRLPWPLERFYREYRDGLAVPLAGFLALWGLMACAFSGEPEVLPYVPLANPVDLTQGLIVATATAVALDLRVRPSAFIPSPSRAGLGYGIGAAVFLWATTLLARSVHAWARVPYTPGGLFGSAVFQTTLSVFWTAAALGIMALSARRELRPGWFAGAALLGVVIVKLFLVDLSGVGTVARIVSFLLVGVMTLVIGYFSPLPPRRSSELGL